MRFRLTLCLLVALAVSQTVAWQSSRDEGEDFGRASPLRLEDLPPGWEAQVDEFISNITSCWQTIGLSASIVAGNQTIYAKGFGATSLDSSATPVDENTLFSIGSTTKAFTSTILGMLVDEGLLAPLGWDTPVTNILKDFTFLDPIINAHITIRDLLAMKTGITIHPWLFFKNATRTENLYEFQHAESQWEMRTEFLYHNSMIALAAHIAEVITGQTWEELVQTRILQPLGMKTSTPYLSEVLQSTNWAKPYHLNDSLPYTWIRLPDDINLPFQRVGPAGSMSSTGADMAQWMLLQLNGGFFPPTQQQLVSSASLGQCHSPQFLMSGYPFTRTRPRNKFSNENLGYGFGWMEDSYRGYEVVWHDGLVFGYNTEVVLMPSEGIGIFLAHTGSIIGETLLFAIRAYIFNLFLGLSDIVGNPCPPHSMSPFEARAKWFESTKQRHGFSKDQSKAKTKSKSNGETNHHLEGLKKHGLVPKSNHQLLKEYLPKEILETNVKPNHGKKHGVKDQQHSSTHRATNPPSNDLYVGTYWNLMYDTFTITDTSAHDTSSFSLFPHHPLSDAPVSLVLSWSVITLGLSTWNGVLYNGTLGLPWSLAMGIWNIPDNVAFLIENGVNLGAYWVIDDYQVLFFNKTS